MFYATTKERRVGVGGGWGVGKIIHKGISQGFII